MNYRRPIGIALFFVLAAGLVADLHAASLGGGKGMGSNYGNNRSNNNNKNSDNYKPGDGESVKKWKSDSLDEAKKEGRPIVLYLYDTSNKTNARAKLLEGPLGLDSAEVKEKQKDFLCCKVMVGGVVKGWPEEWMINAKAGASLFIISSDFKQVVPFDRDTPKENINPNTILAAMEGVLKYEQSLKANVAKAANPANPAANPANNPNPNKDMKKS